MSSSLAEGVGRPLLLAILLFLATIGSTFIEDEITSFRLRNETVPLHYSLDITTRIHEDQFDFNGTVDIKVFVKNSTNKIVLHSKDLVIVYLSLVDIENKVRLDNVVFKLLDYYSMLVVYSASNDVIADDDEYLLKEGKTYLLSIQFTGQLNNVNNNRTFGIYAASYKDSTNKTVYVAATQFEATSAREAFPCYDEPAIKANYVIKLTHGSNYSAISNMPANGDPKPSVYDGMTTTVFMETPLISSYLVAFVISDYDHITKESNGIQQSVYYPPGSLDKGEKSLENALKVLTTMEELFQVKYALTKLDHIMLSKTFGSAMENWGLITYNRENFLHNEGHDGQKDLKDTITQTHEIAHMWFGDLVTPKWWTYSWLNEGFATYYSYLTAEIVYPDWNIPEYFTSTVSEVANNWPISRPMTFFVEKENQIKLVFDMVSYQRAASVIKMFHHALDKPVFDRGITNYLEKYKFSSADERDLFQSLQEEVNKSEDNIFQGESTIDTMFSTWTQQEGIPIISIVRNYHTGEITIQQKFKNSNELWYIPLNFATKSQPDFIRTKADYIMPAVRQVTIKLSDLNITLEKDDWLLVNKQRTGLYHTTYDYDNWLKIAKALNENATSIHSMNRALLFRTIDSVIEKDDYNITAFLELFNYLRNEKNYFVWDSAVDAILRFRSDLFGSQCYEKFKVFIKDVISDILVESLDKNVNSLTTSDVNGLARVLELSCRVDVPECVEYAEKESKLFIYENKTFVNYILTDIILCQGMRKIKVDDFKEILNYLRTLDGNSEQRYDIIYSFVCIESGDIMKVFLESLIGNSSVMRTDEIDEYPYYIFTQNYFARSPILEFLKENYSFLIATNKKFIRGLERISGYVSETDGHKEKFLELIKLINSYQGKNSSIHYNFTKALSKVGHQTKSRESFIKKYDLKINDWLEENSHENSVVFASSLRRSGRSSASSLAPGSIFLYLFKFFMKKRFLK
ncbi:hypothetical protein ACFFRR_006359 [Megaselia abdita]